MTSFKTRVGVNCAILDRGISGSATLALAVIEALRQDRQIDVVELRPPPRVSRTRLGRAWGDFTWDMYRAARAERLDLLISPCNTGLSVAGMPHIVFCHDTNVLDYPERFDPMYRLYASLTFALSVRKADMVITCSTFSRAALRRHWPHLGEIQVLPYPSLIPAVTCPRRQLPSKLQILAVGATEPHKRHGLSVAAVSVLRRAYNVAASLVIVGPGGRDEDRVGKELSAADPSSEWTLRLQNVSAAELIRLYDQSWLLLQTSETEGFGLPVVEACSRALPVIATATGSLPEVSPSYTYNSNPEALAAAMYSLTTEAVYVSASRAALDKGSNYTMARFRERLLGILQAVMRESN